MNVHSFFPLLRERVRISFTDNKGAGRLATWKGNRRVYQTRPDLLLLHLGVDNDDDDNDNNDDEAEVECGFRKSAKAPQISRDCPQAFPLLISTTTVGHLFLFRIL